MNAERTRWTLVALALAATACDDSTGLDPGDLAGTWNATQAVVVNPASPSQTEDLIAGGMTLSFVARSDGTITSTIDIGFGPQVDSGTWSVSGGAITMVLGGSPLSGTISRDGDVLNMSLTSGIEWDFDGMGLEVPARLDMVLVRVG